VSLVGGPGAILKSVFSCERSESVGVKLARQKARERERGIIQVRAATERNTVLLFI
jgi:cob(I)alamin adenosyltransferase